MDFYPINGAENFFLAAYDWYKLFVEAGDIRFLRNYVKHGEIVIDIGVNVGFFSKRSAKWVSCGGSVIAVEPETLNFRQLLRNLKKSGVISSVKAFQGVAAEERRLSETVG